MKKTSSKKIFFISLFSIFFPFLLSPESVFIQHTFAQNISFSISPAISTSDHNSSFHFQIKPDSKAENVLKVVNPSAQAITLHLYGTDSIELSDGKIGFKTETDQQKYLGQWIKFEENTVDLKPGESRNIKFIVAVPANVETKDYLGGIAAEIRNATNANNPSEQNGISIHSRIVLNTYVKVTTMPENTIHPTSPQLFSWPQAYFIFSLFLLILALTILLVPRLKKSKNRKTHR